MEATLKFVLKFISVEAVLNVVAEYLRKQVVKLPDVIKDFIGQIALDIFNNDPAAVQAHVSACAAKAAAAKAK